MDLIVQCAFYRIGIADGTADWISRQESGSMHHRRIQILLGNMPKPQTLSEEYYS